MIELVHTSDYIYMILIAAGIGAIGGLGAELLLKRADNTGTIEIPHRLKDTNLLDIGFPASLIVGAIAAAAILYFFPPVVDKVLAGANGAQAKTIKEYDLVKLAALSLIVGSAGPAFLATAQSRIMSALNAQRIGTAIDTGKTQVKQVAESAKAAVPGAVQQAVSEHLPDVSANVAKAVADAAAASLEETIAPQLRVARSQIDAIGTRRGPDSDVEGGHPH
jgi:hypothetical protein